MKVRVYRATGKDKDCWDAWSIYFPYNKKYVRQLYKETGHFIKGMFLACNPETTAAQPDPKRGFTAFMWDELDCSRGYSIAGLGKKVKDIPQSMVKWIERAEVIWNKALATDDWTEFNERV